MSRATNKETTKIRIIAIYRMLVGRKTVITASEILRNLQDHYGISADRKTIYSDIADIDRFVPIKISTGRRGGYQLWDVLGGK